MLDLLQDLFDSCDQAGIPLVEIRPRPWVEPDIYTGDLDCLLPHAQWQDFAALLRECCLRHRCAYLFDRTRLDKAQLWIFGPHGSENLQFDCWADLEFRAPGHPKACFLSWQTIQTHLQETDRRRFTLPLELEAQYYLSHLGTKSRDLTYNDARQRITDYRDRLSGRWKTVMQQALDGRLDASIAEANEALAPLLSRSHRRRYSLKWHKWRSRRLRARRLYAMLGPDGCGKTAAIEILNRIQPIKIYRFKRVFRRALSYRLFLPLWRRQTAATIGRTPEKNQIDDQKVGHLFFIGLWRAWLLAWLSPLRRRRVVCDRFFPDLLMSGSRFPGKRVTPHRHWQRRQSLHPSPSLYLQLDADPSILLQRKQELEAQQINDLSRWYHRMAMADRSPLYAYVVNEGSLEDLRATLSSIMQKVGA